MRTQIHTINTVLSETLAFSSPVDPGEDNLYLTEVLTPFGRFNIAPQDLMYFENGLLGFRQYRTFALLPLKNRGEVLDGYWVLAYCGLPEIELETTDKGYETTRGNLQDVPCYPCFLMREITNDPIIDPEDLKMVINPKEFDLTKGRIFCLATVRTEGGELNVTMNLQAPIFLNANRQKAHQWVLGKPTYSLQHKI